MLYDICQEGDSTFKQCVLKIFNMYFRRRLHKNFTTKPVYEYLQSDSFGPNYKWIWKAKIPLKIQIF
jgi:hypothetical protein